MMFRLLLPLAAALLCSGCVGPLSGATSSAEPPQTVGSTVQVSEKAPAGSKDLGTVAATSCKNKLWDPEATQENALDLLKAKATALGADGIHSVDYDGGTVSLVVNCWNSVTASGTAFKNGGRR